MQKRTPLDDVSGASGGSHAPEPARTEAREARVPFRERLACSLGDAEAASGLSRSTLYIEMGAGRLDYFKFGNRRLVRVASLIKLIDG